MTKQELRKIYFQTRLQLSESECKKLSQQICDQFFLTIDLSQVSVIHTFLPIRKNNEPDTWLIINRLKADFPAIKISVPKVVDDILVNYYLDDDCELVENKWGITEPIKGNLTDSKVIDLVLVPLLVFDKAGHRVGYGKGYYDRFLKNCRSDCAKIGVSFFQPVNAIEDVNEYDLALDKFIVALNLPD
jgi:5-formyltetrahydrofolate cyclo-ligase